MTAANDNQAPLPPEERARWWERLAEEFDILGLGILTPERFERELMVWGLA